LTVDPSRPLHARVASDNVASRRVLEKCGFRVIATERGFAEARSAEIEDLVLRLEQGSALQARRPSGALSSTAAQPDVLTVTPELSLSLNTSEESRRRPY